MVREFRARDGGTPVVLMGYANPIEAMGVASFAERAALAGVDGVLVVDYPPEEAHEFAALLDARGLAPIFLLSPTTPPSRIETVAKVARGYVYYVSLTGVTGAAHLDTADVARHLDEIRRHVAHPGGRRLRHSRRRERPSARRARRRRGDRQPHHPGNRGRCTRGCAGPRVRMAVGDPRRARRGERARGRRAGRATHRSAGRRTALGCVR